MNLRFYFRFFFSQKKNVSIKSPPKQEKQKNSSRFRDNYSCSLNAQMRVFLTSNTQNMTKNENYNFIYCRLMGSKRVDHPSNSSPLPPKSSRGGRNNTQ